LRKSLTILIVAGPLIAAILGYLWVGGNEDAPPLNIPSTGPITIALAGDVLLTGPLGPIQRDPGFIAVRDAVRHAHFATANLEMNLLGAEEATKADARPAPRWPYGSALHAGALGQLGFDAMSLANDHAGDYGPDATASTIRILDKAGLLHAGTGLDLPQARAPVFAGPSGPRQGSALGASKGRIAFISVAASSMPDARATSSRADIAGRPGLSPLRYTADITVDARTFQTLKESLSVLNGGPVPSEPAGKRVEGLVMFGTPIKKGDRTVVEFNVDEADERAILEQITAARAVAEVVIVSVHSHEPSNTSEEPAGFIRRFSRVAIDAGASLVVGHGPHRLRGVEVYKGGAILYSLGNFLYQTSQLDFRAANMFDAGADLYQAAVGALGAAPQSRATPPDEPAWWEGALAVATFDQGRLSQIRLLPLTLGADKPQGERGMPRMAEGEQAAGILERLARLSGTGDTRIQIERGAGVVRGNSPSP
jgi:poly-gamma-glutamate synthesis protein (capsule biosynthesis protein)